MKMELKILQMCEALLPKTSERNNATLKALLEDIRKQLTAK